MKKILIVDDEADLRFTFRVTLQSDSIDVSECGTAQDALVYLKNHDIDLILLDLRMPQMNGLEFLAKLRELNMNTPVVMITAYGSVPNAVEAMKLGAIDFLEKPLRPDRLRAVVDEVLQRPHLSRSEQTDAESELGVVKLMITCRQFEDAKVMLQNLLVDYGRSAEALNMLGNIEELEGNFDLARKCYREAVSMNWKYEPAQKNLLRLNESETPTKEKTT